MATYDGGYGGKKTSINLEEPKEKDGTDLAKGFVTGGYAGLIAAAIPRAVDDIKTTFDGSKSDNARINAFTGQKLFTDTFKIKNSKITGIKNINAASERYSGISTTQDVDRNILGQLHSFGLANDPNLKKRRNKQNTKRMLDYNNALATRSSNIVMDVKAQGANTYSTLYAKKGALIPKQKEKKVIAYLPINVANSNSLTTKAWKPGVTIAKKGAVLVKAQQGLKELYFLPNGASNNFPENSIAGMQDINTPKEINILRGIAREKTLINRPKPSGFRNAEAPMPQKFEDGGCNCGADMIDTDMFKNTANRKVIKALRGHLGMYPDGTYNDKVKNAMKSAASAKKQVLLDYLMEHPEIANFISTHPEKAKYVMDTRVQSARSGGILKSNVVIYGGKRHHQVNEVHKKLMEEHPDGQFTRKGVPVVTEMGNGGLTQQAEVEIQELVLSKENSDKIADYVNKLQETNYEEALVEEFGKWFSQSLLKDTEKINTVK